MHKYKTNNNYIIFLLIISFIAIVPIIVGCEGGLRGYKPLEEPYYSELKASLEGSSLIRVNKIRIARGYLWFDITLNQQAPRAIESKLVEVSRNFNNKYRDKFGFNVDFITVQFWNPTMVVDRIRVN
jgi:hypothetical protein